MPYATRNMNPKWTALLAVAVTATCAGILGGFTVTPEVFTQILVGVESFVASGLVILVLFWTSRFRNCRPGRQQSIIWVAAGSTGVIICLLPLFLLLIKR